MTRILADLPDEDIERLDRIAREQGKSRAAVLREAVAAYNAQPSLEGGDWIDQGFGLSNKITGNRTIGQSRKTRSPVDANSRSA